MKVDQLVNQVEITLNELQVNAGDGIVVGCSGGVDSMVLVHILHKLKYRFGVYHMNAGLRGIDSDKDQTFVENWCKEHDLACFSILHDLSGMSGIQEVARDFRRKDMENLLLQWNFKWIATAHHLGDVEETFLMRLFRGAGLDGLISLNKRNANRIRPLLSFSKAQLIEWAQNNGMPWREDASNASSKYTRNAIRNELIPLTREIDPRSETGVQRSIMHLRQWHDYANSHLQKDINRFISIDSWGWKIELAILDEEHGPFILSEWMRTKKWFDFPIDALRNLQIGKRFENGELIFEVERDHYRLRQKNRQNVAATLNEDEAPDGYTFSRGPLLKSNAVFCAEEQSLNFPLEWRLWQDGDAFIPLGMNGKKKISDLLTDKKVPHAQRAQVHVLLDQRGIVWVEGLAISDRVKVTSEQCYRFIPSKD